MMLFPASQEELAECVRVLSEAGIRWFLLGNGSNTLFDDEGFEGVIVRVGKGLDEVSVSGREIYAGAGALLSQVARAALRSSLTGLEFAAGIPGSVGGGVMMNAGAYGGELKDVLKSVRLIGAGGSVSEVPGSELELGYRTSRLKRTGEVVAGATFELEPGDAAQIEATMEDLASRRREKQPLEYPSAGSTFKRPEGYYAGKLIEDAGLRGRNVGGAQVSEKHCGFIVNKGGATAGDIKALIRLVQDEVRASSGVSLETEVLMPQVR